MLSAFLAIQAIMPICQHKRSDKNFSPNSGLTVANEKLESI
jgi:hypothetical protein